jgi:hypothetical protein
LCQFDASFESEQRWLHSQEDLAKFGNRSDMKVENFQNPFVFWLPAKTCCKILAIYICVCVCARVWQIRAIFSQKSFACVKTIVLSFFLKKTTKITPKKTLLAYGMWGWG